MKSTAGGAGNALDPTILREYDIRGVVGKTLTEDGVAAIGRAFGTIVARHGGRTVAVGYDGRLTSPLLEAAAVSGLTAAGVDVARVGLGPTPMLYFATHSLQTDAGLMITGSHNPPEYNGIKMVLGEASFFGADIQRLGDLAAAGDFTTGEGRATDRPVAEDYVRRLLEGFEEGRPLRVAWDPGNGAAGEVIEDLCARLPGRHVLLNERIDGSFPGHHPDPTVEANLEQLKAAVAAEACDLGLAFDGDGDRIGAVDSLGRVLWGDQLLAILAADVLAEVPGATVIADVKASQMLFDEVERLGGKPIMWCTGHSLIKAKMAETGAEIAGEMSGHIFIKHRYYGFDDAIYAALRLLSIVGRSDTGSTGGLSGLRDRLPAMVNTPEVRFECADGRKFEVVDEVKQRLGAMAGVKVSDIDGVRVGSVDGWWLLRASNTQPVLVARCESSNRDGLARLKAALVEQLRLSGLEAPDFG